MNRLLMVVLFLAALGFRAVMAQDASVEAVRLVDQGSHTEVVFSLSQALQPHIFTLAADSGRPYRIVIDLPSVNWQVDGGVSLAGRGLVQQVRYGVNRPGASRIVLDLPHAAIIESYRMIAPTSNTSAYLTFNLVPTDHAGFVAAAALPIEGLAAAAPSEEPGAETVDDGSPFASIESVLASLDPGQDVVLVPEPAATVRPIIIIDPGHGGRDPGSVSVLGDNEKDIVLDISRAIVDELNASGMFEAHLTRNTDEYLRLNDRYAIAQAQQADLFISVHVDSNDNADARGLTIYTLSEQASDGEAARVAERENQSDRLDGYEVDEELTRILIDLAQRETMNLSAQLATIMIDNFNIEEIRTVSRPHRFAGFRVLTAPDVPSILLETGFGSNRQDAQLLTSEAYHGVLARGLTRALVDYFELDPALWLAENASAQN